MTDPLPTPLVSTEWLARRLGEPGLVVVDGSWYLPAMHRSGPAEYEAGHIPGAVFWDLDELSDRESPLPHMLPSLPDLARGIGVLGIGNTDRVVAYDGSGINLSAARVWWTLRLAGHDQVAVLDGGLKRWQAEGRPLASGRAPWEPKRFVVHPMLDLLRSREQTHAAMKGGSAVLLDARSRGRFAGSEPEPRPGLRGGHIPGARNLPIGELVTPEGLMLPAEELRRLFTDAGLDLKQPVITSCGSGVSACALALALEVVGHQRYAVYDGSWSEWGRPDGPPIEQGKS